MTPKELSVNELKTVSRFCETGDNTVKLAEDLGFTRRTVRNYLENAKLKLKSRTMERMLVYSYFNLPKCPHCKLMNNKGTKECIHCAQAF